MARRLVVTSNRLPVALERGPDGPRLVPGSGGLVTALAPVLRQRGGVWVGWAGGVDDGDVDALLREAGRENGHRFVAQRLSHEDVEGYYHGFANQVLWPIFHDLPSKAVHEPRFWRSYRDVNAAFADTVADVAEADDLLWIHDYHLLLVGRGLRERGARQTLGYFLHTPFPQLDIFMRLPWRLEILDGLLQYDVIGVQTARDHHNLVGCLHALVDGVRIRQDPPLTVVTLADGREVRIGAFPISIDFAEFSDQAARPETAAGADALNERFTARTLALGVDRLDYTKGIPNRLDAFERALEKYPDLRGGLTLVQVVVPSRRRLPEYDRLKMEIDRRIGEINGRFSRPGWTPIHYHYGSLPRQELITYYRACDVVLVTSIKDGMNLVVKEFCAASPDLRAAAVLSEFTGAAAQMHRHAIMVNPNDVEATADAIRDAVSMPANERAARARALRDAIRRQDIEWWVEGFLDAASGRHLTDHPEIPRYLRRLEASTPKPRARAQRS